MKRSIPTPRNILMSYHYFKDYDLDQLPHLTIIGDSGAFSANSQGATITTKDLANWATTWRHKLKWVASLDVIGNPVRTYSNWRDMVDGYGVKAIPTIHYGTNPAELDKYARRGVDLVGLGGLVRVPTKAQMRWLIQVFKYAREHHPDMQFHGWGCTSTPHFRLPFYSVDSSSWTSGVRYGQARLIHPKTGDKIEYRLNGKDAFKPEIAQLLNDYYGVSPRDASYSNSSNRETMVRIHSLAESAREQLWQNKHGPVKVPKWGVNVAHNDRSLHLALGGGQDKEIINKLSEEERSIHLANINPQLFKDLNHMRNEEERSIHLVQAGDYFPQLNQQLDDERSVHLATGVIENSAPHTIEKVFYKEGEDQ